MMLFVLGFLFGCALSGAIARAAWLAETWWDR